MLVRWSYNNAFGCSKISAETKNFDGTVQFIFQPAEEGKGGGEKMMQTACLSCSQWMKFMECTISQVSSWRFAVCHRPIMAARDNFEVLLKDGGRIGYAASGVDR